MCWAADRRLDYIDFRMLTAGHVNRGDLVRTFGVSVPQASKDLQAFMRLYRGSLVYDKAAKRYAPRNFPYRSRRGLTARVVSLLEELRSQGGPLGWA